MAEGTVAADQLRLFIERIERLARQEQAAVAATYANALGLQGVLPL